MPLLQDRAQENPSEDAEANSSMDGAGHNGSAEQVNRSGSLVGDVEPSAASSSATSSSAESSDGPATSEVIVQSGEAVDMADFSDKSQRPMMEMIAGSNVWYQAHIQESSRTKMLVLFPETSRQQKAHKEWVLLSSSRIWRGSLASRQWKYLSSGAWQPREGKARTRRKRGTASSAAGSGGRGCGAASTAGTSLTPSGTIDAAQSKVGDVAGEQLRGEEPDVASPCKRHLMVSADSLQRQNPPAADNDLQAAALDDRNKSSSPGQTGTSSQDPLVDWFSHHFRLLADAGLLQESSNGSNAPEAGWLPVGTTRCIRPVTRQHFPIDRLGSSASTAPDGSREPDSVAKKSIAGQLKS